MRRSCKKKWEEHSRNSIRSKTLSFHYVLACCLCCVHVIDHEGAAERGNSPPEWPGSSPSKLLLILIGCCGEDGDSFRRPLLGIPFCLDNWDPLTQEDFHWRKLRWPFFFFFFLPSVVPPNRRALRFRHSSRKVWISLLALIGGVWLFFFHWCHRVGSLRFRPIREGLDYFISSHWRCCLWLARWTLEDLFFFSGNCVDFFLSLMPLDRITDI